MSSDHNASFQSSNGFFDIISWWCLHSHPLGAVFSVTLLWAVYFWVDVLPNVGQYAESLNLNSNTDPWALTCCLPCMFLVGFWFLQVISWLFSSMFTHSCVSGLVTLQFLLLSWSWHICFENRTTCSLWYHPLCMCMSFTFASFQVGWGGLSDILQCSRSILHDLVQWWQINRSRLHGNNYVWALTCPQWWVFASQLIVILMIVLLGTKVLRTIHFQLLNGPTSHLDFGFYFICDRIFCFCWLSGHSLAVLVMIQHVCSVSLRTQWSPPGAGALSWLLNLQPSWSCQVWRSDDVRG